MNNNSGSDQGGLEARYVVYRHDQKPIPAHKRYMVMEYSGDDPEARICIWIYGFLKWILRKNKALFKDIRRALRDPHSSPPQHQ